jgi:hypothetical protein
MIPEWLIKPAVYDDSSCSRHRFGGSIRTKSRQRGPGEAITTTGSGYASALAMGLKRRQW